LKRKKSETVKTVEQILEKFGDRQAVTDDATHFNYNDLLQFVPFRTVYKYLDDKVTPIKWGAYYLLLNKQNVVNAMRRQMKIAWGNICYNRSLNTAKDLAHFKAWLWILERDKLISFIESPKNYPCHGAPCLREICNAFKWNWTDFVDPRVYHIAKRYIKGRNC